MTLVDFEAAHAKLTDEIAKDGAMPRRSSFAVLAILLLAGCASTPVDPQIEASAGYQNGYVDGCKTSTARAKTFDRSMTRDETTYSEDDAYRRGWNAGYRICGTPATRNDPYAAPASGDWKTGGPLN